MNVFPSRLRLVKNQVEMEEALTLGDGEVSECVDWEVLSHWEGRD